MQVDCLHWKICGPNAVKTPLVLHALPCAVLLTAEKTCNEMGQRRTCMQRAPASVFFNYVSCSTVWLPRKLCAVGFFFSNMVLLVSTSIGQLYVVITPYDVLFARRVLWYNDDVVCLMPWRDKLLSPTSTPAYRKPGLGILILHRGCMCFPLSA
jgi:hypothetical protein